MMRRLVVRPPATANLLSHYAYIARDRPAAAERFLAAAEATFALLARRPGLGALWRSDHPALAGVRRYPVRGFRNYLVFYVAAADVVEVLSVFHGAQDINAELGDEAP